MLRNVSKILLGEDKDRVLPIDVFACIQCGCAVEQMLPDELKSIPERKPLIQM